MRMRSCTGGLERRRRLTCCPLSARCLGAHAHRRPPRARRRPPTTARCSPPTSTCWPRRRGRGRATRRATSRRAHTLFRDLRSLTHWRPGHPAPQRGCGRAPRRGVFRFAQPRPEAGGHSPPFPPLSPVADCPLRVRTERRVSRTPYKVRPLWPHVRGQRGRLQAPCMRRGEARSAGADPGRAQAAGRLLHEPGGLERQQHARGRARQHGVPLERAGQQRAPLAAAPAGGRPRCARTDRARASRAAAALRCMLRACLPRLLPPGHAPQGHQAWCARACSPATRGRRAA